MRSEAFADCGIEELVEVTLPAYTSTEDGKHVPAFVATMVATPMRKSQLHMKLDAAHLDWLRQAVHGFAVELQDHEVEVAAEDLPDIEQPNVRWFKRKGRPPTMLHVLGWGGSGGDKQRSRSSADLRSATSKSHN